MFKCKEFYADNEFQDRLNALLLSNNENSQEVVDNLYVELEVIRAKIDKIAKI